MQRREFLHGASASVLAAASFARVLGANDRLGMALVGSGRCGREVMKAFLSTGRVELRCIADVYDVQRGRARDFLGVKPEEVVAIEEALGRRDVDAVLIGSPDHLHLAHAQTALKAGKHIYLEKPTTHHFDEGEADCRRQKNPAKSVRPARSNAAALITGARKKRFLTKANSAKLSLRVPSGTTSRGSAARLGHSQNPPGWIGSDS